MHCDIFLLHACKGNWQSVQPLLTHSTVDIVHATAQCQHALSAWLTCTETKQEAEQMERVVKPFLDSHMQALLLELLSVLQLLRLVLAA